MLHFIVASITLEHHVPSALALSMLLQSLGKCSPPCLSSQVIYTKGSSIFVVRELAQKSQGIVLCYGLALSLGHSLRERVALLLTVKTLLIGQLGLAGWLASATEITISFWTTLSPCLFQRPRKAETVPLSPMESAHPASHSIAMGCGGSLVIYFDDFFVQFLQTDTREPVRK